MTGAGKPLVGWKSIAAHFQRDERTVMRWAATRALPVKRIPGGNGRSSVYADSLELDAWLKSSRDVPVLESAEPNEAEATAPTVSAETAATVSNRRFGRVARWATAGMLLSLIVVYAIIWRGDVSTRAAAPQPLPADSATRELYLQASYDWNERSPDTLARAIKEYGSVIAQDPRYEPAYVGLANSYLLIREYGAFPEDQAYPRATAAVEAALALRPDDPAAHRALGFIAFWWNSDRDRARSEFAEALRLAPNDPLTHHWLGTALLANGEPEKALHEMTIARSLNPTSTAMLDDYLLVSYVAHRDPADVRSLQNLERANPEFASVHRTLADIVLFQGDGAGYLAEARALADLRKDKASRGAVDDLAQTYASGGLPALQRELVARARADATPYRDYYLARTLAVSGRGEEAGVLVARICRDHEPGAIMAAGDLWLTRSIPRDMLSRTCGGPSLVS